MCVYLDLTLNGSHFTWSDVRQNHPGAFPSSLFTFHREVASKRRSNASIRNARRNIVTATLAEMYGNCTWLTYRLGMAPGYEVSSSCITDATSGRRQGTHCGNHPQTSSSHPLLLVGAASYTRDRLRSSSIVWLRETLPDGYTRPVDCLEFPPIFGTCSFRLTPYRSVYAPRLRVLYLKVSFPAEEPLLLR